MDGQLTAVHIIGFVAQQVEKLGVDHGDQKVKGAVRIAHDIQYSDLFSDQP